MDRLEVLERLEARIRAFLSESEDARPSLEAALVRIVQRKDAELRLRSWEG